MNGRTKDMRGLKFARLTVVEYYGSIANSARWLCKCDCGKISIVRGKYLRSGHTKSCGCFNKEMTKKACWTGVEDISGKYISKIVNGAKSRNLEFNLTKEEIWNKYIEQNKLCNLTGMPIYFTDSEKNFKEMQTASLDRIDPTLGYNIKNIQWIHKKINYLKREIPQSTLLHFIYLLKHPIKNDIKYIHDTQIKKHGHSYRGCGDLSLYKFHQYKIDAKKRNIKFKINAYQCWDLFLNQNKRCSLTGLPLFLSTISSTIPTTASLDRIDSRGDYEINNIRWVHTNINKMKWDTTEEDFINYCNLIYNHIYNNNRYN